MTTTWFIAKEYLKRLEMDFEEKGRKTFCIYPASRTYAEEIEVFPGTRWITLTTRLLDMSDIHEDARAATCEQLLRANARLTEVSFGIDKKGHIILQNAIPVIGISYDAFSATLEAHINGIRFFEKKMLPKLTASIER